jgi:hypothetical protein
MRVPVAVYRWFANGGGWAYDPLCARRFGPDPVGKLDEVFDPWLKDLRPGRDFAVTGRGHWAVWVEHDPENLDPRTRPGETFILRAVFFERWTPAEDQLDRIRELMRQRSPAQPGEDAGLALDLGPDLLPRRWGCGLAGLVLGAVVAGLGPIIQEIAWAFLTCFDLTASAPW